MGDIQRATFAFLVAASCSCCSAPRQDPPPGPTADAVERPDRTPEAPHDPLPGSPDFGAITPLPTPAPAPTPASTVFLALDDAGALVRFTSDATDAVTTQPVTGLAAGERLIAIAVRPSDGVLHALGASSRLYRVDRASGVASAILDGPFAPGLDGDTFGLAFDGSDFARVRVTGGHAQNLALDPITGWVANDDPRLAYGDYDALAAEAPDVVTTAFARGMFFGIDTTHDVLARLLHPGNGSLDSVGPLGVDAQGDAGFDVAPDGQAYAALHVDGETALYTVDLVRGAATRVAAIGVTSAVRALAVER
jgi:hypothetical protein